MDIKNWIWTSDHYDLNKPVLCRFRRVFSVNKIEEHEYVHITADTRYKLYVNGQYVGNGPRKGDNQIWFYDRIDLSPYLHLGKNVIAVTVLRYPPVPYHGCRSEWRTRTPGFWMVSESGNIVSTDKTWKTCIVTNVQISCKNREYIRLYQEETVYGMPEDNTWVKCEFDDASWSNAVNFEPFAFVPSISPAFMKERSIPFLYEMEKNFKEAFYLKHSIFNKRDWDRLLQKEKPLTIPAHCEETVDILAEKLTTGFIQLGLIKGAGARIQILESEAYSLKKVVNGREVLTKEDRLDYKNGQPYGPIDEYHAGGYGTVNDPEYYEPYSFREFRIIRLFIKTNEEPLTIVRFNYRETGYPLLVKTHVKTNDPSLNSIWNISLNTLQNCMHETYEDCPGYEQLQYAMDARSEMLFTYVVSADDRLARQAIDDFSRSQRPDGLIASCYPTYKSNVIPVFSIYYVLMLYDHMMYFGDKKFLHHYWPSILKVNNFFIEHMQDDFMIGHIDQMGLLDKVYWGYIDSTPAWFLGVPPTDPAKPVTMLSLLFMTSLKASSAIADYLNYVDQKKEYDRLYASMQKTIQNTCIGKDGLVQDAPGQDIYSQVTQIFAVLNDVVTGKQAIRTMKRSLQSDMMPCSLPMVFYQLRALQKCGLYAYSDKIMDRWRRMLEKNLTTCLEHDDETQQRSDCHAWASIPLYEIPAAMLGITPAKPGFASVHFEPAVGYLSHVEGDVITPKGLIHASWKIADGKLVKKIELPDGMRLE